MFKLTIKLLALTVLLTAGLFLMSGGHASAAIADNCGGAPYSDWGYTNGAGSLPNAMSSLMLRAVDTSNSNAPINTRYVINSMDPNSNNPDFQKRIFQWIPGTGPANRQATNTFNTGENLKGTRAGEQSSCNGWSVLGPGIPGYAGNGYVLDCGDASHEFNIKFWISHVDNPGGAPGTWKLYNTTGGIHQLISDDVNNDNGAQTFNESNGGNISLRLEWNPAPTTGGGSGGSCQTVDVSIDGSYFGNNKRAHVVVNQVTNGQVKINSNPWQGGTGGNIDENIPSDSGGTGPYEKVYAYQPQANSITVTVTVEYHNSSGWHTVPGPNNPNYIRDTSQPCFTASCSITSVDGDGPGGIVLAGHTMHIHGVYNNTSPSPDDLPIWNPSLSASGSQNPGNNHGYTLWSSPPPAYKNWPYGFDIYMTAPNSVTQDNFSLTPIYFGGAAIGGACSGGIPFGGVPVYQQFSASVSAQSTPSPTIENPSSDSYGGTISHQWVNPPAGLPGHGINNPVSASFYQKKAGGGQTTPCSPSSYSSSGPYNVPSPSPPGYDTVWSHNCAIAPGSFAAGDEFCSTISATYSGGYLGPDNNVIDGTGPTTDTKCPRVVNEPYFKVYHSDISAGGDFDKCTTNGGTLAGYADISDPSGATRGSTTQLSALALLKITGVASAKTSTDITGSPTKLTFANDPTQVQVDTAGNESPVLGGQIGGCRTLTNETAPASAKNLGGGSTGAVPAAGPGAYTHTGNLTISGGTLGTNQNVSIFVTGNAYISNDITYGNGWQAGTAPSFILHATGNIYIAPGVKQLAGVYLAQSNSAGAGGKIYTCADLTGFAPMSATNLYNGCKNQLVVFGSFVADQINLMRSFGSLRDEIPNPGSPGSPGTTGIAGVWSCGGGTCNPNLSGDTCIHINEPGDPDSYTWADNQLCLPGSSSVKMAWTYYATNPESDKKQKKDLGQQNGHASVAYLKAHGFPYCTPWTPKASDGTTDDNNWGIESNGIYSNQLCLSQDIGLTFGTNPNPPGQVCLKVYEPADPLDNWPSGYYLCAPVSGGTPPTPPTAKGPPFIGCSNLGAEIDTNSCAGEIFEYSPALYLSNGGGTTQPPGGGSLQLQSITSLPPVL